MQNGIFRQLRTATPFVPIPEGIRGLSSVAEHAEEMASREFASCFWNTPARKDLSDSRYLAMVIAVLKKRGGMRGVVAALELIGMLEANNVD